MLRFTKTTAVILLVGMVSMVGHVQAEVSQPDQKRMELVKAMHERELAQAKLVYDRAVKRANDKIRTIYEASIRSYEARKDTQAVEVLKNELAELVGQDQSEASSSSKSTPGNIKLIRAIGPVVNAADGSKLDARKLASYKYMLIYFSAHWCPPCRGFTPKLVEYVNAKHSGDNFNLVFVSNDRSEADMFTYMTQFKMPWVAVPFNRIKASGLQSMYGGPGIPNLVLIDSEGQVISGSYKDGKYVGPQAVLNDFDAILAKQG